MNVVAIGGNGHSGEGLTSALAAQPNGVVEVSGLARAPLVQLVRRWLSTPGADWRQAKRREGGMLLS